MVVSSGHSAVKGTICDIMRGAQYIEVNPYSYIPFTCIRKTTQYKVLQCASIFFGVGASQLGPAAGGIAFSINSAIVARLDEDIHHLVESHFKSLGCSD